MAVLAAFVSVGGCPVYSEWETAVVHEDTRKQYAEPRFQATGYIGDRLHVMVFCLRADAVRVISLRKANKREGKSYAET